MKKIRDIEGKELMQGDSVMVIPRKNDNDNEDGMDYAIGKIVSLEFDETIDVKFQNKFSVSLNEEDVYSDIVNFQGEELMKCKDQDFVLKKALADFERAVEGKRKKRSRNIGAGEGYN